MRTSRWLGPALLAATWISPVAAVITVTRRITRTITQTSTVTALSTVTAISTVTSRPPAVTVTSRPPASTVRVTSTVRTTFTPPAVTVSRTVTHTATPPTLYITQTSTQTLPASTITQMSTITNVAPAITITSMTTAACAAASSSTVSTGTSTGPSAASSSTSTGTSAASSSTSGTSTGPGSAAPSNPAACSSLTTFQLMASGSGNSSWDGMLLGVGSNPHPPEGFSVFLPEASSPATFTLDPSSGALGLSGSNSVLCAYPPGFATSDVLTVWNPGSCSPSQGLIDVTCTVAPPGLLQCSAQTYYAGWELSIDPSYYDTSDVWINLAYAGGILNPIVLSVPGGCGGSGSSGGGGAASSGSVGPPATTTTTAPPAATSTTTTATTAAASSTTSTTSAPTTASTPTIAGCPIMATNSTVQGQYLVLSTGPFGFTSNRSAADTFYLQSGQLFVNPDPNFTLYTSTHVPVGGPGLPVLTPAEDGMYTVFPGSYYLDDYPAYNTLCTLNPDNSLSCSGSGASSSANPFCLYRPPYAGEGTLLVDCAPQGAYPSNWGPPVGMALAC